MSRIDETSMRNMPNASMRASVDRWSLFLRLWQNETPADASDMGKKMATRPNATIPPGTLWYRKVRT